MFKILKNNFLALSIKSLFLVLGFMPLLYAAEPEVLNPGLIKDSIDREMATNNWNMAESKRAVANEDTAKVVPVECKKPSGKFPWNFEKAKMEDVVKQISGLTCKNFILSKDVKASQEVSMVSRTAITVDQAWQAFMSMLESNDLALVLTGQYYTIVNRKDSSRQPLPVINEVSNLPYNEGMVTYLHDVRHIGKDIALTLVKSLIGKQGEVISVGDAFLVISDGASNIRRIMNILEKVDVSGAANRVNVVDLVHADAQQVQAKLNEIFDSKNAKDSRMYDYPPRRSARRSAKDDANAGSSFSVQKIIADDRTNKLIVIASEKAFERIKEMIDILDSPSSDSSTQGQINVYYLKNGDAKKIAATLSSVIQSGGSAARRGRPPRPGFREEGELFEGDIRVTADETTNSLVIVASPRDYKSLIKVIALLDRERIQVYVEAAILDIGLTDSNDFGMNAFAGIPGMAGGGMGLLATPGEGTEGGIGLATGLISAMGAAAGGGSAAIAGLAGLPAVLGSFNFVGSSGTDLFGTGVKIPDFGLAIEALQKYSNIDVLSTPSLLTMDNEKAEMSVGEKVPTVSGASTIGGTNGIPIQNITYQDVKLKFAITPHVNDDNMVRLEIDQDVNELGQKEKIFGQDQYRIRTKSAKTTVVARDQQTIVIGGLISESRIETETKVPFFGDIPILGYLFGKKTGKKVEKKNLLLILTPYVIRSEEDLRQVYARKTKEREEFGKLYFGDKITKFDPHVDYTKKVGPVNRLIEQVDVEMQRIENGGGGLPNETVIKSETSIVPPVTTELPKENDQTKPSGLDVSILNNKEENFVVPPPLDTLSEEDLQDALDEELDQFEENIEVFEDVESAPPVLEE